MAGRRNDAETVDERRERLLLLHVSGKSPRELAEREGISLSQVYRDLQESSAGLREGVFSGRQTDMARMVAVCQEIGARALSEGRYGAALRAVDLEARLRSQVPAGADEDADGQAVMNNLEARLRERGHLPPLG